MEYVTCPVKILNLPFHPFSIFTTVARFSLARSLSLAHLTPSFDTLFVFKPTPQTIYTRKYRNDPVFFNILRWKLVFYLRYA